MEEFKNFHLIDHALIQHKLTYLRDINTSKKKFRELVEELSLTYLRDINTSKKKFRELVEELSMLMAYEVTKDLPLEDKEIETPLEKMTGKVIRGKKLTVVPILRAGLGMVDGIINLIPSARVGHIGLYRDHDTFKPVEYYFKVPISFPDSGMRGTACSERSEAQVLENPVCSTGNLSGVGWYCAWRDSFHLAG